MGYSIKILSNEEFEGLPYRHSDIALGLADPKHNTAYVRYSVFPELTKYLVSHEFDHLVEKTPTDEIDGVRYKIPLIGPLLSGLGKGFMGQAAPSYAQSFLPNVAGGIAKVGTGVGTALGTKGLFGGLQSLGSGASNLFGGGRGGFSGVTSAGPGVSTGYGRTAQLPVSAGITGLGGFGTQQTAQTAQRQGFGGILDAFKNPATLLGGLSLGAGLLKKYPKPPELPPSVDQFRSFAQSGGGALGQQAQGVISGNLMNQFNPLTSEEQIALEASLERSRQASIKEMQDKFATLRPGTEYLTDSAYKLEEIRINNEYAARKAELSSNRTREAEDNFHS